MIHCVFLQYKQTEFVSLVSPYKKKEHPQQILDKGTCKFGSRTSRCHGAEGSGSKQTKLTCVLFAIKPMESKLSKPTLKYKRK